MPKILLVEDEKILRDAFAILLESQGYQLSTASTGEEALTLCAEQTFDLILLDLMMPILDGVGFLEKANLAATAPQTRIVIMSNLSSGEVLGRALKLGAHRNIVKSDLAPKDVVRMVEEELAAI